MNSFLKVIILAQSVLSVDISDFQNLNIELSDRIPAKECNKTLTQLEVFFLFFS